MIYKNVLPNLIVDIQVQRWAPCRYVPTVGWKVYWAARTLKSYALQPLNLHPSLSLLFICMMPDFIAISDTWTPSHQYQDKPMDEQVSCPYFLFWIYYNIPCLRWTLEANSMSGKQFPFQIFVWDRWTHSGWHLSTSKKYTVQPITSCRYGAVNIFAL